MKNKNKSKNKSKNKITWKMYVPNTKQRKTMYKKCAKKCFLLSSKLQYPICRKNTCKINPLGVQAAYTRAKQYHHYSIASKALQLKHKLKI